VHALSGLKVIDASTLFAGPVIATLLGDFGAEVLKVEHPGGDALRSLGWEKDGISLWWLFVNRNKRCVTLDLGEPQGQALLRELVAGADVLVENFRPGRMERWGLCWDDLARINPGLVMVRVTGFGQDGPYRNRPGFGTLAEAMSGFAHLNGYPDGPPTLPPFALGDGVAACFGAFAALAALRHRDGAGAGAGQMIDLSIYEPLFWILGAQVTLYDQLGVIQGRTGNRAPFTAPRNAFQAGDGRWFGLSASSQSIAERVARLVGRGDLVEEDWFRSHHGRLEHQDEIEDSIAAWIGSRPSEEVIAAFEAFEAAIAPIYSMADIMTDPQYQARETIATASHPVLGPVKVPGVVPRLSATPGEIRHLGRALGEDNEAVYVDGLGYQPADLAAWKAAGVI
jgi:crotonobetainyl-CoA:carnitine CoA-transferase CaiB-like acyl-CoA transferase